MGYQITWRVEPNGDFFEQSFTGFDSASRAVAAWRKCWRLAEGDCVVFKLEKKESE